jgi:excinuclease UvrABC ATPase subunit
VVEAGTPEEVDAIETSHTGWFLRKALTPSTVGAVLESP